MSRILPLSLMGAISLIQFSLTPAVSQTTFAGTQIANVASVIGLIDTHPFHAFSNTTLLRTGELLDLSLSALPARAIELGGSHEQTVAAQLLNTGNGAESFHLAAVADPSLHVTGLAIDKNGNGAYDAGTDVLLAVDAETGTVLPGASITILVLLETNAATSPGGPGSITLVASAQTGSGKPGASFIGKGDGGGDAVVGLSSARAEITLPFIAEAITATLTKTQAISNPSGGAVPVVGTVITYTLTASFTGHGSIADVSINDPIPAGTRYVVGSLRLDGARLETGFDGNSINVGLGAVVGPAAHTIVFQAMIQ